MTSTSFHAPCSAPLAAVLLAGTLLAVTPAQANTTAALRVDEVQRRVFAKVPLEQSAGLAEESVSVALFGRFDEDARSQAVVNPRFKPFATAEQRSFVGPLVFGGSGSTVVDRFQRLTPAGFFGGAVSTYQVVFTLDRAFEYAGFANLAEDGSPVAAFASFVLQDVGPGPNGPNILQSPEAGGSMTFAGSLAPGRYRISASAVSTINFADEALANASYRFRIAFTQALPQSAFAADVSRAAAPVPEPSSWALALLGLVAVMARCRKVKTPTLQTQSPGL
jgi:hypothetical protein